MPLPEHYLLGFDEQKIEAEGIPVFDIPQAIGAGRIDEERRAPQPDREKTAGYTVYLDGELRDTGWLSYYLRALLYKVPEGTWLLIALSLVVLVATKRSSAAWFDELALWTLPVVILLSMSLLTDINLGLRYVLAILPYVFISTGKVVPWCLGLREPWRRVAGSFVVGSLALTIAASAWIHPSYLVVLQLGLGRPGSRAAAPDRQQPRLGPGPGRAPAVVEGQHPRSADRAGVFRADQPVDLRVAGRALPWFLPPGRPGTVFPMPGTTSPRLIGPAREADPRLLRSERDLALWPAVAALRPGPAAPRIPEAAAPNWKFEKNALTYFQQFQPIMPPIGHSIYVYRLSEEDVARVNAISKAAAANQDAPSQRLAADIDLREVILMSRPEEDVDLEARPPQQLGQVGPELGEDRIAPVAAGMADPRGAILDTCHRTGRSRGGTFARSGAGVGR